MTMPLEHGLDIGIMYLEIKVSKVLTFVGTSVDFWKSIEHDYK